MSRVEEHIAPTELIGLSWERGYKHFAPTERSDQRLVLKFRDVRALRAILIDS